MGAGYSPREGSKMYQLYYLPGACSLATQILLRELGQPVSVIHRDTVENYMAINPTNSVPALMDGDQTLTEGVAIILYLLGKHQNTLMPVAPDLKQQALTNLLFANATMHPAYGRLFFLANTMEDSAERRHAMQAAAKAISDLWQVVEDKLAGQPFLGGDSWSVADLLLTVYSRWGGVFDVDIEIGSKAQAMIDRVLAMPTFQAALLAEEKAAV